MVSIIEMHGFYYKFQAALSAAVFFIASQLIKPSTCTSLWSCSVSLDFIFMIMLGSMEIIHNFFSSVKSTPIVTFIIINIQIY
jgi:hypothetical protein